MAKPIGIALGVVGSKAPLPAEAVVAHAKPLQSPSPSRNRRRARNESGAFVADNPETPAVDEAWSDDTGESAPTVTVTEIEANAA